MWKLEKKTEQKLFLVKKTAGVDELRVMETEARIKPIKSDDDYDDDGMDDVEGVADADLAEDEADFEEGPLAEDVGLEDVKETGYAGAKRTHQASSIGGHSQAPAQE